MRSVVVKIGSSSLTRATGPDPMLLAYAMDAALRARSAGWSVILVSSGAVASGLAYLERTSNIRPSKRLAAAVGQPFLVDVYRSVAEVSGDHISQILVSESDLRSSGAVHSVISVLNECHANGVIPIVNGNDVTDSKGSDNDAVAVALAVACGADKLLLLTDVAGVYPSAPDSTEYFQYLTVADIQRMSFARTGTGRGGMRSKLHSAELAAYNGIETTIAYAHRPNVIADCLDGEEVGTTIRAVRERFPSDQRWISGAAISHGKLVINRAAEASIKTGSSLFASGIKQVRGDFEVGEIVDITSPSGVLLARGSSKVSGQLMNLIRTMRTEDIALVIWHILSRFQYGNQPRKRKAPRTPSDGAALRPQLARAICQTESMSFERARDLAKEIMLLFPSATVNAMLGVFPTVDEGNLRSLYASLSSDLSLIDRKRLVVF
jgi:glutamate 5-kinase